MSHHCGRYEKFTNRRDFLKKAGAGFGLLALADLLQDDALLAADIEPAHGLDPMAPRQPHYPAKAKSIIWLFMEGAPSSVDLFDPKPELTKRVVNPTTGAAAFLATADATQRGTDSLSFRTACSREGTLCSDMSLGTTFAVATDSGLAPATPYQETL